MKDDSSKRLDLMLKNSEELQRDDKFQNEKISNEIKKFSALTDNKIKYRDSISRSTIAATLTRAFIAIIIIIIVGAPVYNLVIGVKQAIDIENLLKTFNAIFGTLLGFALGYYFKGHK